MVDQQQNIDAANRQSAAIIVSDLTAPPTGTVYQLSMIGPGRIRSGGVLPTSVQGTEEAVITHGLGDIQTIGLTLEPAHGSAMPTTTPVLLLPVPA